MAGWRPLPDTTGVEVRHLITELRRLKDATGLSFAELAARTHYSKSSWERYLNGAKLPPRPAVEALTVLAEVPPARLLALWDLAEPEWSGRGALLPAAERGQTAEPGEMQPAAEVLGTGPERPYVPHRRAWALAAAAAAGVLLAAGAIAVVGSVGDGPKRHAASVGQPTSGTKGIRAKCHGSSCDGKDPTEMGCGGDVWTAAERRVGEAYIELRFSNSCRTAWGRIDWGWPGDGVSVTDAAGHTRHNRISYDRDAYTRMIPAPSPGAARACVDLKSGRHGCTGTGGSTPLPEPPPTPTPTPTAKPSPWFRSPTRVAN